MTRTCGEFQASIDCGVAKAYQIRIRENRFATATF
jgi:hypothetical protein